MNTVMSKQTTTIHACVESEPLELHAINMESDTERKYKVWLRAEIVVVFVVIVLVWGLLLLPVGFFYLPARVS